MLSNSSNSLRAQFLHRKHTAEKKTENGVEFSSSCYQFFLNRTPQNAVHHNLYKIVVHLYTFKK